MMNVRTRSRPGARFVAVLAVLAALAATAPARGEPALGPLPWRVAGTLGFTVDAAAFPDSAGRTLDVYVRVPPATLADLARDESGARHLHVVARLRAGGRTREREQDITFAAADSVAGFGKVVVLRFPTWEGRQRLWVRLEDPGSNKRGLLYIGRKVREAQQVDGEFAIEPAADGREISDVEFAWAERRSGDQGPFQRLGHTVIPNPERLYGRYAEDLGAFFTARSTADDARPWHWEARLLGAEDTALVTAEGAGPASPTLDGTVRFGIGDRPAGGYDLEVEAWQEGDSLPMRRRARFSIAWKPRTWFRNPRDVEDDIHFLLSADESDQFALLHPGEQEAYLEAFWRDRDPTPGTEVNETREAFFRRIHTANERYSRSGIGPGMFSDMGRVYIRYGDPSEVLHQVIPTGDDTVSEILQELALTEDRALGDVHQKGLGGDQRPFEVWIYEGDIPLPLNVNPAEERIRRRRRIVFLFVDEHGVGDYRLRYSSE